MAVSERRSGGERLLVVAALAGLAAAITGFTGGWPGDVLSDGPGVRAWIRMALDHHSSGGVPYWVDDLWAGTPAWALGPFLAVAWVVPLAEAVGVDAAMKVASVAAQVVGAWGAFVFARSLWGGITAPALAGFLFGLSPLVIGHTTLFGVEPMIWVVASLPWFAWALRHALDRGGAGWIAAAAMLAAFSVLQQAEHAYGFASLALAYVVVAIGRRWRDRREEVRDVVLRSLAAGVLAAGLCAHWLLPLASLADSFVLTPADTVRYELTERGLSATPQVFVSSELHPSGPEGPGDPMAWVTGAFYLGVVGIAAALVGTLMLHRDREGWLTATVIVSAFSIWTSTGGVPLARGSLGAQGAAAFCAIGLFAGACLGAVVRHIRPGRKRLVGAIASIATAVVVPFVAPFLALQNVVPLLSTMRFPRFYPVAVLGVSLAAAWVVVTVPPLFVTAAVPRARTLSAAALALLIAGAALVDLEPYRRYYELDAPRSEQAALDELAEWASSQPPSARIGTQMFDRPHVMEALQQPGVANATGWPHPLAGAGVWTLTGETQHAEAAYARRAMAVVGTQRLVADPHLEPEPGEELVGGYRVTTIDALPVARRYEHVLLVADRALAGRLATSLAAKGVATVVSSRDVAIDGATTVRLPDVPCPQLVREVGDARIGTIAIGPEVARACAMARWAGLPRSATPGAELDRAVSIDVDVSHAGLQGIALDLDRPPGPARVAVQREGPNGLGPVIAFAQTSGRNLDGHWTFRFDRPLAASSGSYVFTLSCTDCGRGGGPRVRTVPDIRAASDVTVDGERLAESVAIAVPLYGDADVSAVDARGSAPEALTARRVGAGRWAVDASGDGGLVVLATTWFPGWNATGEAGAVEVVQADGGLVGLVAPRGVVAAAWSRPVANVVGRAVTALAVLVTLALLAWEVRRRVERHVASARRPGRDALVVDLGGVRGAPGSASAVVTTSNDGGTIAPLLRALLDEPAIDDVTVVASGCTDDTVGQTLAVAAEQRGGERISVVVEDERSGKANALNLGFAAARHDRIVAVAGDVLPLPGAVSQLLRALDDDRVGMAGGRPIPANGDTRFLEHGVHLLWNLHHRMALRQAKLGEMVVLRRDVVDRLPPTSVDEATLQALVEQAGFRSAYVPTALVRNWGPRTVADFVRQRRRIHGGHLWLEHRHHYAVPSLHPAHLLADLLREVAERRWYRSPRRLAWTAGTVALEVWARACAHLDLATGREQHVWTLVTTAKDPARSPDRDGARGSTFVPTVGVAEAAPGQRDDQHQLPVQLHVRYVQRVRAEGEGADARRVDERVPVDGELARVDDVQRR